MSIYVDNPMPFVGRWDNYSHLWADSDTELHAFADALHLPRRWLQISHGKHGQFIHYDVSLRIRALALAGVVIEGKLVRATFLPLAVWLKQKEMNRGTLSVE